MNLAIDIGNTRIKAALFSKNELQHFETFESPDSLLKFCQSESKSITNAIVASVTQEPYALIASLNKHFPTLLFESSTPVPIKNSYQSAATLGSDRLAAAVGANSLFPSQTVLSIDCGTCIKYNLVTQNNEFVGGAISPGLNMRFSALNYYTARLPLLSINESYSELIGHNTNESIYSGVQMGYLAEISSIISQYCEKYPDIKIITTGGDAPFLEKALKKAIFAEPYLLLKGLVLILNFNTKA